LTHRCSSHPSYLHERSSRPSLLSIGNPLVHWATTSGLLGNSGSAPLSGHRVCCCRSWPPVWRLLLVLHGVVAWLCSMAISMAGADAWASFGPMGAAVRGRARRQRSGLPSSSNFDSSGTHRRTNLQHGAHVWRPGRAPGRQRESCGKPWRPREWSAGGGWSLLGRAKGPSAHAYASRRRRLHG
jgi:hypothetical protein